MMAGMIAVGLLGARTARAQDAQAGGSAGGSVGAGASATTPAVTTTTTVAPTPSGGVTSTTTTSAPEKDDTTPDHELVIRRFAVGYLGVSQLPIATGGPVNGAIARDNVNAPIIGARYWVTRLVGIDAGLGLGLTTGSTETSSNGGSVSVDNPSRFGLAFHGGVPLGLVHGKHYTFEVVPETNIGFASGTIKVNNGADQDLSGFRFDLGARAGAEIYFGFIGIPQLALQASVGLYFRREVYKWKQDTNSISVGNTSLSTSVQADPWALFVNNISAFYYF